jgi:hypothetical protein
MKKIIVSSLVLACLLLFASGLHAQKPYVGILVGYSAQSPKIPDSVSTFAKDSSLFYGARIGLKVMMFSIEGIYYRAAHELIQEYWEVGDVDWREYNEMDYSYIGVNAKFFPISVPLPPVGSFRIFLSGGYGSYTAEIKLLTSGKDTNAGLNFGGGVELKVSKISFLVEGRYHTKSKFRIADEDLELGKFYINAGINIYIF